MCRLAISPHVRPRLYVYDIGECVSHALDSISGIFRYLIMKKKFIALSIYMSCTFLLGVRNFIFGDLRNYYYFQHVGAYYEPGPLDF